MAGRAAPRGVAADRVAVRGAGADQILALHATRRYRFRSPRRSGEITLADRARLSGTQAGTGLCRLRGARLAWLPPSRHTLYRRLRLPDRRTRRLSPLRTGSHRALRGICPSRRFPTQRRPQSGPNGTCRPRSPASAGVSSSLLPGRSPDAPAATRRPKTSAKFQITDAVRLVGQGEIVSAYADTSNQIDVVIADRRILPAMLIDQVSGI